MIRKQKSRALEADEVIIQLKERGKRFETKCYKNALQALKSSGKEQVTVGQLDEYVPLRTVYSNAQKGDVAKKEDMRVAFSGKSEDEVLCHLLIHGAPLVNQGDRRDQRHGEGEQMQEVCRIVAGKVFDPSQQGGAATGAAGDPEEGSSTGSTAKGKKGKALYTAEEIGLHLRNEKWAPKGTGSPMDHALNAIKFLKELDSSPIVIQRYQTRVKVDMEDEEALERILHFIRSNQGFALLLSKPDSLAVDFLMDPDMHQAFNKEFLRLGLGQLNRHKDDTAAYSHRLNLTTVGSDVGDATEGGDRKSKKQELQEAKAAENRRKINEYSALAVAKVYDPKGESIYTAEQIADALRTGGYEPPHAATNPEGTLHAIRFLREKTEFPVQRHQERYSLEVPEATMETLSTALKGHKGYTQLVESEGGQVTFLIDPDIRKDFTKEFQRLGLGALGRHKVEEEDDEAEGDLTVVDGNEEETGADEEKGEGGEEGEGGEGAAAPAQAEKGGKGKRKGKKGGAAQPPAEEEAAKAKPAPKGLDADLKGLVNLDSDDEEDSEEDSMMHRPQQKKKKQKRKDSDDDEPEPPVAPQPQGKKKKKGKKADDGDDDDDETATPEPDSTQRGKGGKKANRKAAHQAAWEDAFADEPEEETPPPPPPVEEKKEAAKGGKKGKKVEVQEPEEEEEPPAPAPKKGKKGKQEEAEPPAAPVETSGKKKKKGKQVDTSAWDDYAQESEEEEEAPVKKGKKGKAAAAEPVVEEPTDGKKKKKKKGEVDTSAWDDYAQEQEEEEETPAPKKGKGKQEEEGGKKKKKGKKDVDLSAWDDLSEEEEPAPVKKKGKKKVVEESDEEEAPAPKKKGKKGKAAAVDDEEEAPAPTKKKGKKAKALAESDEDDDDAPPPPAKKKGKKAKAAADSDDDDDDAPAVPAKKKGKKKAAAVVDSDDEEEEAPAPKKKGKGKKKEEVPPAWDEDSDEEPTPAPKKKKKGGK